MQIVRELKDLDWAVSGYVADGERTVSVQSRGFSDLVVWNPGETKAAALADLDPGGWRHMLCLEAATIGAPVHVAAGESWSAAQILKVR